MKKVTILVASLVGVLVLYAFVCVAGNLMDNPGSLGWLTQTAHAKDILQDPVNQGNADIGGGRNSDDDGAGLYNPTDPCPPTYVDENPMDYEPDAPTATEWLPIIGDAVDLIEELDRTKDYSDYAFEKCPFALDGTLNGRLSETYYLTDGTRYVFERVYDGMLYQWWYDEYQVKTGDTLSEIIVKMGWRPDGYTLWGQYGLVAMVAKNNGIKNPNLIHTGDTILWSVDDCTVMPVKDNDPYDSVPKPEPGGERPEPPTIHEEKVPSPEPGQPIPPEADPVPETLPDVIY